MKVYLAGPDVYRPDAKEHFNKMKATLALAGHEGLAPLDNEVDLNHALASSKIYQANIQMIKRADVVLANISPFRGPSLDPGTAFEIGYAVALGKPVIVYTDNFSQYKSRVPTDGYLVEDFSLIDNLMIVHGSQLCASTFEEAIELMLYTIGVE